MQKNNKSIKFNGASLNAEFAAGMTEEEYVSYGSSRFFLNLKLADRETVLREAYKLSCKEMEVEPRGFNYMPNSTQSNTEVSNESPEEVQDEPLAEDPAAEEKPTQNRRRGR